MQRLLSYDFENDNDVFLTDSTDIKDKKLNISACTTVGSGEGRRNEDGFAVIADANILNIGVFDGSTCLKPTPNIDITGARYASHLLINDYEKYVKGTPKVELDNMNAHMLSAVKNLGIDLNDTITFPSTGVVNLKIDFQKNSLQFANVLDPWLIVYYKDGTSKLLTTDLNAKFDQKMFKMMSEIAKRDGITPREAMADPNFKKAHINMFLGRNNNPNGKGCGVLNGDPNMLQYIQAGEIDLTNVKNVLAGTDGLYPPEFSLDKEADRVKMLEILLSGGMKKLIELKKEQENSDPDFVKHVRYKLSDDATGVLVELE